MSTPVALVLGGHGLLGQPLAQQLAGNGWEAQSLDFEDCNLLNPVELQPRIEFINPDVIFNTVSWNTENPAEKQPQEALSVNSGLPRRAGQRHVQIPRPLQLGSGFQRPQGLPLHRGGQGRSDLPVRQEPPCR